MAVVASVIFVFFVGLLLWGLLSPFFLAIGNSMEKAMESIKNEERINKKHEKHLPKNYFKREID